MMSGSGAYSMKDVRAALKPVVREALANGGAAIGGMVAGPTGMAFGKELGAKFSRLIGSGDYETNTSVNALIRPPGGLASAAFAPDQDMVRIRRREFLTDVLAPSVAGTFTNTTYSINPGLRTTFPFLSQISDNYEEYCFDGLVFEFISSASPYVAGSALGTIVAAMEYNSSAPPFPTKYQMENSANAISTRLDKNLMYGVECAKGANAQNCYYVRNGSSVLPLTTTDLGLFQLAVAPSTSVPASSVLGELWVSYDVLLKRPVLNTGRYGLYHGVFGTGSIANPFGTTVVVQTNNGIANFRRVTSTTITYADAVPGDQWVFTWYYQGTVNAAAAPTVPGITSGSGGVTALNALANDTASFMSGGTSGGAYVTGVMTLMTVFTFTLSQPSGVITFPGTGTNYPTGSIQIEVIASYLGNSLVPGDF